MKTTLFVLTYNEIEGMKAIMPRIKKEWVDEIIVVGDGSTYGTLGYAKSKAMWPTSKRKKDTSGQL